MRDDLDELAACADCDAIVNELRKILRGRDDMSVSEELRRANNLLGESLAMWLAVHRREKEHPCRNADDAGTAAIGGRTFGVPA
jgi:hypothetical protein